MLTSSAKNKGRTCRRCKQKVIIPKGRTICDPCRTRCSTCGIQLTNENFDRTPRLPRKAYRCKTCVAAGVRRTYSRVNMRDYNLQRNYGINLKEYELILKSQKGLCYICGCPPKKLNLSVDHLHIKGEKRIKNELGQALIRQNVRGLLCWNCNKALGSFKDNPEFLRKAAIYLETMPAQHILNEQ